MLQVVFSSLHWQCLHRCLVESAVLLRNQEVFVLRDQLVRTTAHFIRFLLVVFRDFDCGLVCDCVSGKKRESGAKKTLSAQKKSELFSAQSECL